MRTGSEDPPVKQQPMTRRSPTAASSPLHPECYSAVTVSWVQLSGWIHQQSRKFEPFEPCEFAMARPRTTNRSSWCATLQAVAPESP